MDEKKTCTTVLQPVQIHKIAVVAALFIAVCHAGWSFLVAVGVAQPLLDFIFRLHMIDPPYHVGPFSAVSAISLILVTSVMGYMSIWILATLWNVYALERKRC